MHICSNDTFSTVVNNLGRVQRLHMLINQNLANRSVCSHVHRSLTAYRLDRTAGFAVPESSVCPRVPAPHFVRRASEYNNTVIAAVRTTAIIVTARFKVYQHRDDSLPPPRAILADMEQMCSWYPAPSYRYRPGRVRALICFCLPGELLPGEMPAGKHLKCGVDV